MDSPSIWKSLPVYNGLKSGKHGDKCCRTCPIHVTQHAPLCKYPKKMFHDRHLLHAVCLNDTRPATRAPCIIRGGRVVRRCWLNFQCRGVLQIWIIEGQGPIALAVGAGEGCLDIFSIIYHFSFLSPSLWETARYRLKYCLKGPFSLKQPNQPSVYNYISRTVKMLW